MKKNIVITVLSNIKNDARVRRQIEALKKEYQVTVICFDGELSDEYELVILPAIKLTLWRKAIASVFLLLRFYSVAYKILHNYFPFVKRKFAGRHFDLVIANDAETLPLAFAFRTRVLFDAHEYAPRHFEDKLQWRIFFQGYNNWLCKNYIPLLNGMTTVGKALAREYKKNFGLEPTVITNASNFVNIQPGAVSENKIKLVHHGIINRSRKLELMIDLMNLLDDRFTLDMFLLMPVSGSEKIQNYINEFRDKARSNPHIKILEPVRSSELVRVISQYDIGVFLLPPVNFNYRNALPNKLFDFIQARLGIAIGPTPEMAEIVKSYHNGVISDDFAPQSLAMKLNALTKKDVEAFKDNSHKAASVFNAESNALIFKGLINRILN